MFQMGLHGNNNKLQRKKNGRLQYTSLYKANTQVFYVKFGDTMKLKCFQNLKKKTIETNLLFICTSYTQRWQV